MIVCYSFDCLYVNFVDKLEKPFSILLQYSISKTLTLKQLSNHVIYNARKTTQGEAIRLEIELISPKETQVAWRVNDVIIGGEYILFASICFSPLTTKQVECTCSPWTK